MSESVRTDIEPVAFTLDWYRAFLQRLRDAGYHFRSFDDELSDGEVLLRHDVDLSVDAALRMASVEAELGIESTYLFLLTTPLYNPIEARTREQIRTVADLGHDVGLHFSTHQYWDGGDQPTDSELREKVRDEQTALDALLPVDVASTISFHIPPDWVLGHSFDGIDSAYRPAVFEDIGYVADSGQRWRRHPPAVGDFKDRLQILTHPGLYRETDGHFQQRVEQAVDSTARRTRQHARREFLSEVNS